MDDTFVRLLPWTNDGRPCYLSTDNPHGRLSRLADQAEEEQLCWGEDVADGAGAVLADEAAGEVALRFALRQTVISLQQVVVVAHSRGQRIPG